MKSKNKLAFMINSKSYITHAKVLVDSIRISELDRGETEIMILIPDDMHNLKNSLMDEIKDEGVTLEIFHNDDAHKRFPFKDKVYAAAHAETLSEDSVKLIWTDCDMFFIKSPSCLGLEDGFSFGYRPVDFKIIGSPIEEAPDDYWERVYEVLQIDQSNIFTVTSSVDRQSIRAYFNTGLMIVKPQKGLFRKWKSDFDKLFLDPEFMNFYRKGYNYAVFIHQAALAGTVLSSLERGEMQELDYKISYPLHLHKEYPEDIRPNSVSEIVCCRYHDFFNNNSVSSYDFNHELKQLLIANKNGLGRDWNYEEVNW